MNDIKNSLTLLGTGFVIGVILTVVILYVLDAKPKTIAIGPLEFEMPTDVPIQTQEALETTPKSLPMIVGPTQLPLPTNTLALPTITPTSTPFPTPTPDSRLFWDDFSSLPKSDWNMEGVNYSLVDDKLVAQNGSFSGYVGDNSWTNYAVILKNISIPLSSTDFPSRFIDIPIRMTDKNNAIVFRAHLAWAWNNSSGFSWLILKNGEEIGIPGASGNFQAYNSPVIIRLEANGPQYLTIINGSLIKSFADNTFVSGGTGIRTVSFDFSLDEFYVEKLP